MKAGRGRAEQAVRLRAVLEPFFVHAQLALPFFTLRPCPFPHLRRPFLLLRCCPFFSSCAVLQVFVANPNKAKPILDILIKNREKLVTFLSAFHNDRQGLLPRCCRLRTRARGFAPSSNAVCTPTATHRRRAIQRGEDVLAQADPRPVEPGTAVPRRSARPSCACVFVPVRVCFFALT